MPAQLIVCGESAVGVGGEFEREAARSLRDQLPTGYIIATNVYLARNWGGFYECDAVIAAPGICDILEMKCARPEVLVTEDAMVTSTGFSFDRIFSTLDSKAKVLVSRLARNPFPTRNRSVRVNSQVVVPSDTRINFKHAAHANTKIVRTVADTVLKYKDIAAATKGFAEVVAAREIHAAWCAYRDSSAKEQRRTARHLGRFAIRKQLTAAQPGAYEYFAVDEPPCQAEVHLTEFPFDPAVPSRELDAYLLQVARETRILMKVRHPYVACVIGHFQTGCSWVQVSDWFDGEPLEDLWPIATQISIGDKLAMFLKVVQALQYCHEKGVFHRNLSAKAVRCTRDFADMRLGGFECALDLAASSTTTSALARRDPRLVPPEELLGAASANPRLGDIFQSGVLLYRILENGEWPFTDTVDYVTSSGAVRPFAPESRDIEVLGARKLVLQMMQKNAASRPDILRKVEEDLAAILAGTYSDK